MSVAVDASPQLPAAADSRKSSTHLVRDWVDFGNLSVIREPDGRRVRAIGDACGEASGDDVAQHARRSGGLLLNLLRAMAWPLLLGAPPPSTAPAASGTSDRLFVAQDPLVAQLFTNDLSPHKDEDQIMLDIKRLFTVMSHMNIFNHINSLYTTILSPEDIEAMRKRLFYLMVRVLRKHPALNYYQGYHDVASVVLLVCNELQAEGAQDEQAFLLLERLTLSHLRDFMIADIGLSINHLKLIPLIAQAADRELFELVRLTSNSFQTTNGCYYDYKFYQALLSILTLYSHDVGNFSHLAVLWDFILSYRSVATSLYVYVAAMMHFKKDIFAKLNLHDAEVTAVDPDLVHTLLSPTNLLGGLTDDNLDEILTIAASLIERYPPEKLPDAESTFLVWFGEFNTDSVLMTTSSLGEAKLVDLEHLDTLLDTQEHQQQAEALHEIDLFQRALEQDSMATSINSLDDGYMSKNLLSSSLSSLTAASSGLGSSLARKSSALFKLIFSLDDDETEKPRKSSLNLYKIGVTVGFVGFVLHFLIKHADTRLPFRTFHQLLDSPMAALRSTNIRSYFVSGITNAVGDVFSYVRDSEVVNSGLDLTQVGLGTLRSSIYAIGTLH